MTITVIIPAYNEEALLPRALAALVPQVRAIGAELIVVDNNSTDKTAAVATAAGVRVIHEPQQGVVFAMNRGLHEATGDIVAFTDADTIVDPRWLSTILESFKDQHTVAVTGLVRFDGHRWITWLRWFYRTNLLGSNMAVRRTAGLAVGGFDLRYNLASDIAFGWRLAEYGTIRYLPEMVVTTSARRFQAHPFRETARYTLNHIWMLLFRRPLFWDFTALRPQAEELRTLRRRRQMALTTFGLVLIAAYLMAWPTSSVFGQISVKKHTSEKIVALTFDDGPNGAATRQIVDILVRENVPATFFEVGRSVQADPATAKYVADHGFTIGNHSWDHSFKIPTLIGQPLRQELEKTSAIIYQETGLTPTYFRPPHGFRSPQMIIEAKREHLRVVDWLVDPQDYNTGNATKITSRIVRHIRPGAIVLLHDGLQDGVHAKTLRDRAGTIAALPQIIAQLRAKGYTFVTLDQITAVPPDFDGN